VLIDPAGVRGTLGDPGMFRSLHVGIDRYADPGLQWLSGAVRDAEALHALFADTFGTGPALLCDKAATASGIRTALMTLASEAGADDIVVVTFAGAVELLRNRRRAARG